MSFTTIVKRIYIRRRTLLAPSIMDRIRYSTLNTLRELVLDGFRNNGSLSSVLGMGPGSLRVGVCSGVFGLDI